MTDINAELFWELNRIGIALTAEKDVESLLERIVLESMKITRSDGGSLYVRANEDGREVLRFKIAKNSSREFPFKGFSLPMDGKSIAGFVATSKHSLQITDVEAMPQELGFKYNAGFDFSINYRTVNMMVVPMIDYRGGVVGVLQLINKKRDADQRLGEPATIPPMIVSYTPEEERIIRSLASQAAMLIERAHLYEQLKGLPFSFIDALIAALDSRDSFSSGHSRRVAACSRALTESVNHTTEGPYKGLNFSSDDIKEIYYAALLHDIGKIGVSEAILLKTERLSPERMRSIRFKFLCMKRTLEQRTYPQPLEGKERQFLDETVKMYEQLTHINRKSKISTADKEFIDFLYRLSFLDWDGKQQTVLDTHERDSLSVEDGKLNSLERDVMELHVTFSYDLLRNIKWPDTLARIPAIVKEHHERLDGSGYPEKLSGNQISLAGRILAIADRFDDLACKTHHGVVPVSIEDALKVITNEGKAGILDYELINIFLRDSLHEREEITKSEFVGDD